MFRDGLINERHLKMCGLFGWFKFNEDLTSQNLLEARNAISSISHRGPDDKGEWAKERIFMGHQRLKIIDLTQNGAQPFHSFDGRYVLCYNGEIYNYLELRRELQNKGVCFQTNSDTEVFLAAFIAWGPEAFSKFEGMFSAAIHDRQSKTHFLVRDHLGQKPLYYHSYEGGLVYASELRALLALQSFNWELSQESIIRFLMTSYHVWDNSPLRGVKKLLPGCYLKIQNGLAKPTRYWDSIPGDNALSLGMDEAVEQFSKLFERSCQICLRSDVPYGVLLSGGLDSSLALRFCMKGNPDINAFSISMEDRDFDEGWKAKQVAQHLNIGRHATYTLAQETIRDVFYEFLNRSDEPHGDPGFVNMLFLAKSCREDLTVAIAGDGGDELFAGYMPFAGLRYIPWFQKVPETGLSWIKEGVQKFLSSSSGYLDLKFKMMAYLQGFPASESVRYPLWLSTLSINELKSLCPKQPDEFFSSSGEKGTIFDFAGKIMGKVATRSSVQQLLYFYQKAFLPEFVCFHTDRSFMQYGLEVRSPFLTKSIIEFANRLPDHLKLKNGVLKRILRESMKDCRFPRKIFDQKKQGFTFPVSRWLRQKLRPRLGELLKEESLGDFVDIGELRHLVNNHIEGKRDYYRILFNLIALSAWRKKYPALTVSVK